MLKLLITPLFYFYHLLEIIGFVRNTFKMRSSASFWLLFGIFLLSCPLSVLSQWNSLERNQLSTLRPTVARVFSRKKRWMIFPKGSHLKFTVNVSKRLLALYPKGFNFNLEAAIYYPMPAARIDLIPKRFRKPTTKAPPPLGGKPVYLVGIPGSLLKYRAKPASSATKTQRIDQKTSSLQLWPPQSFNLYQNKTQMWSKYSSPTYLKKYQWSKEKKEKFVNKYSKYNEFGWSRPSTKSFFSTNGKWHDLPGYTREPNKFEEPDSFRDEFEPIHFAELEPFEDSPHYHSYRGRRELFHHFEGISKM